MIKAHIKGKDFQIDIVNKGIANRFSNYRIEIHKKLLQERYAPLLSEILFHEASHTDKWWSVKDLSLDIGGFRNRALYWNFILSTPSSWCQFLPLYKSKGIYYLDFSLVIFWIVLLIAGGLIGTVIL